MSEIDGATPRKMKLRRIKPSPPQEIIQQNLLPLKENIKKKQRAQEAYYENHGELGVSPLTRPYKRPVHQRLGRKIRFNGTNTSAIPPKRRLRKVGSFGTPQQMRRERIFTAQNRINRIRAQQREMLNGGRNFNMPKKVKLRRTLPQHLGVATNLQVQVKNNHAFLNVPGHIKRFRQVLDAQLQLEIKKIQMEYGSIDQQPIMSVTPVMTSLPMHTRFAALS